MISCSQRIQEILDWVHGNVIADIGCDHAYVVCNAILSSKARKGYACDVALGPLENAKKTILENHLENQIQCCLLDGIQGLSNDVDQIVIAGMGGKLIMDILSKGQLYPELRLLLSCHKDEYALRQYLMEHSIHIVREKVIYDHGHYYPVMDCIVKDARQDMNEACLYFGKNVVYNTIYEQFLDFEEKKYQAILTKVKKDEFVKKLKYIKEIRNQRIS